MAANSTAFPTLQFGGLESCGFLYAVYCKFLPEWRFGLMGWPAYAGVVRPSVRPSVTKWGSRISRERFDLGSPNFTGSSIPINSTAKSEITLVTISGLKLSQKKTAENATSHDFESNFSRTIQRGLPNFTRLSGTIGLTNVTDMTPLAASGRLQNAIKYSTKVRKTRPKSKFSHVGYDVVSH